VHSRTPSPAELQQRDVVAQQIEAYRGTGTITDAQMQELKPTSHSWMRRVAARC